MIVKDIMKRPAVTCGPDSDLGSAVEAMRTNDCGFLPVVEAHGILVGVVTDRDVCLRAGTKHRAFDRISVRETMSHPVYSCFPDENVKTVLVTMAKWRVRRLPVLNRYGHLEGVLSIDDVVEAPFRRGGPTAEDILTALKEIYASRPVEAVPA
jgi:CBS domain-containing protein